MYMNLPCILKWPLKRARWFIFWKLLKCLKVSLDITYSFKKSFPAVDYTTCKKPLSLIR